MFVPAPRLHADDSVLQKHTGGRVCVVRDILCVQAAMMMRVGPSGSAFRSGSQTTPSGFAQEARS